MSSALDLRSGHGQPGQSRGARRKIPFGRDFRLLWQGQAVSQVGNQTFAVLLLFWTREATGSSSAVGLLLMLSSLPGLLLGPLAGALSDRCSRRALLLGCDLVRGTAFLVLAAAMARRMAPLEALLFAVAATALLEGSASALVFPAVNAALPDLVPAARVQQANSLYQVGARAAAVAGQAAGGLLYAALGAAALCLLNALTFYFAALCTAFVTLPRQAPRAAASSYLADLRDGLRFVRRQPGMLAFLLTTASLNFFFMPVFVLLPFYATDVLSAGGGVYGSLTAAFAAGGLVGLSLTGARALTGRARRRTITAALFGTAFLFGALGTVRHPVPALAILFAIGLLTSIVNVLVITLSQTSTPAALRGRVLGFVLALSRAASPLGMAFGGLLGDLSGHEVSKIYLTCGAVPLVVVAYAATRPALRVFLCGNPPLPEEDAMAT